MNSKGIQRHLSDVNDGDPTSAHDAIGTRFFVDGEVRRRLALTRANLDPAGEPIRAITAFEFAPGQNAVPTYLNSGGMGGDKSIALENSDPQNIPANISIVAERGYGVTISTTYPDQYSLYITKSISGVTTEVPFSIGFNADVMDVQSAPVYSATLTDANGNVVNDTETATLPSSILLSMQNWRQEQGGLNRITVSDITNLTLTKSGSNYVGSIGKTSVYLKTDGSVCTTSGFTATFTVDTSVNPWTLNCPSFMVTAIPIDYKIYNTYSQSQNTYNGITGCGFTAGSVVDKATYILSRA